MSHSLQAPTLDDLYGEEAGMVRSDFCRAIATFAAWVDNQAIDADEVEYLAMVLASTTARRRKFAAGSQP